MTSLTELRRRLLGPTQKELRQEELQVRWDAYRARIGEVNRIWPERKRAMENGLKRLKELAGKVSESDDFSLVVNGLLNIGPDAFDSIMYVSYDVVDDHDGERREYFYHKVEGTPLRGVAKDLAAVHVGWNRERQGVSYIRLNLLPKTFGDITYHYTLGFTDKRREEVGLYISRTYSSGLGDGYVDHKDKLGPKELEEAKDLLRACANEFDNNANGRRRGTRLG